MEILQMILRLVQLLWAIIVTALIGNVMASNQNGHEAAINYALFSVIMAWLALLIGFGASVTSLIDGILGYALVILDLLAALFTFISGIVLAARIRGVNCGGNLSRQHPSWIGFGSANDRKRCREIQASTAFMWFLSATLFLTLIISVVKGASGRRYRGSSAASNAPHMSQVGV